MNQPLRHVYYLHGLSKIACFFCFVGRSMREEAYKELEDTAYERNPEYLL